MDIDDLANLTETRRAAVAKSIRPIGATELKALADTIFPFEGHPWRQLLLDFLAANAGRTFHHAKAGGDVEIVYCRDQEKGLWFVRGSGVGPMQPTGLAILREIVDRR